MIVRHITDQNVTFVGLFTSQLQSRTLTLCIFSKVEAVMGKGQSKAAKAAAPEEAAAEPVAEAVATEVSHSIYISNPIG